MEISKSEIEHLARERFQAESRVVERATKFYEEIERWYFLIVAGKIIGARRTMEELPELIRRGPAMEVLNASNIRPIARDYQNRVPEDSRAVARG